MFQKIVTSALFAGFCAGLIAVALQLVFVNPVLLHAELYEGGELVHFGAGAVSAHPDLPGPELMRDGLSVLFNALTYTGYAFMLVASMALAADRGVEITLRSGLLWGIAGYVSMHLAPAFSLPPEVPGVASADVGARQVWWWATAAATALALGLFAFSSGWGARVAGVALVLAPHLIGAPHPDAFAGPVPPEIAALFAARTLGTGLVVWAVLGLLAAYFWQKETATA